MKIHGQWTMDILSVVYEQKYLYEASCLQNGNAKVETVSRIFQLETQQFNSQSLGQVFANAKV